MVLKLILWVRAQGKTKVSAKDELVKTVSYRKPWEGRTSLANRRGCSAEVRKIDPTWDSFFEKLCQKLRKK